MHSTFHRGFSGELPCRKRGDGQVLLSRSVGLPIDRDSSPFLSEEPLLPNRSGQNQWRLIYDARVPSRKPELSVFQVTGVEHRVALSAATLLTGEVLFYKC